MEDIILMNEGVETTEEGSCYSWPPLADWYGACWVEEE
jgi:hypothetical protein